MKVLISGSGRLTEQFFDYLKPDHTVRLIHREDLISTQTLIKHIGDTEAIYHVDELKEGDEYEMYFVNIDYTWTLLNAIKETKLKTLYYVIPQKLDENTIYGAMKLSAVYLCQAHGKKYGYNVEILTAKETK